MSAPVELVFPLNGHRNTAAPTPELEIRFISHMQSFRDNPTREKPSQSVHSLQGQLGNSFLRNLSIIRLWPRTFLSISSHYNFMIFLPPAFFLTASLFYFISPSWPSELKEPLFMEWMLKCSVRQYIYYLEWNGFSQPGNLPKLLAASTFKKITPCIALNNGSVSTSKGRERESVCVCVCVCWGREP